MSTTTTTTIAPPSAAPNHTVDIPLTPRPSTPIKPRHASTTALAATSSSTSLRIHTLTDQPQAAPPSVHSPESPEDAFYASSDPLLLNSRKMSETDIKGLRKTQGRQVQNFYREQNELIDVLLGPLNPTDQEEEEKRLFKVDC